MTKSRKKSSKRNFVLALIAMIFLFPLGLFGQDEFQLDLQLTELPDNFSEKQIKYKDSFRDSVSLLGELNRIVLQLQGSAYLEASIDSMQINARLYTVFLHVGNAYRWANLHNGNIDELFLAQAGYREKLYRNKAFHYTEVQELLSELLDFSANNGYPFARVWLDSIQIEGDRISAQVFMDKNQLILLKEIKLEGDAKISENFLSNYLGLKVGNVYDQAKILRIKGRIRELPFLDMEKDPTITFEKEEAILNLFLKKKRASRFDFLIGILPNSSQVDRLLITGSFNGELQNQFAAGERIYAKFEQLRPETQRLDLEFSYPYILNLPFGVDLAFNLYKRDTSYLDLEYDLGIQYLFEGGNYLKAYWNNRSSTLLTIDEDAIMDSGRLPPNLDVTLSTFGLEYLLQRFDYRFNPRKGWGVFLRGGAGTKKIKQNTKIEELGYGELYDTLSLRSAQYRIEGRIEGFLPLFGSATIKGGVQGGYIISDEPIYMNEQYRIGGNKILRGFDEEFIFATTYSVLTVEPRLLIDENSYLFLFLDYAYIQNKTVEIDQSYFPLGFGAGITFETSVGLFGVSLAFGKLDTEPIDFSAPKVHFGYVSMF